MKNGGIPYIAVDEAQVSTRVVREGVKVLRGCRSPVCSISGRCVQRPALRGIYHQLTEAPCCRVAPLDSPHPYDVAVFPPFNMLFVPDYVQEAVLGQYYRGSWAVLFNAFLVTDVFQRSTLIVLTASPSELVLTTLALWLGLSAGWESPPSSSASSSSSSSCYSSSSSSSAAAEVASSGSPLFASDGHLTVAGSGFGSYVRTWFVYLRPSAGRPELKYRVVYVRAADSSKVVRQRAITALLRSQRRLDKNKGMVYALSYNALQQVNEIFRRLHDPNGSLWKTGIVAGTGSAQPPVEREDALRAFQSGDDFLLLCNKAAGCGLNIAGVHHVINQCPPFTLEDLRYVRLHTHTHTRIHTCPRTFSGVLPAVVTTRV